MRHLCSARTNLRRPAESGFTLMETVVTLAILSILAGVVGAAFSVGFKILGAGGSGHRLVGSRDQSVFEQLLARDVSRAACIVAVRTDVPRGSCANVLAHGGAAVCSTATGTELCVGWPLPDLSCHLAVYARSNGGEIRRQEFALANGQFMTVGGGPINIDPASFGVTVDLTSDLRWVKQVTVQVSSLAIQAPHNPPGSTLRLRPLASDPSGPGLAGPPC